MDFRVPPSATLRLGWLLPKEDVAMPCPPHTFIISAGGGDTAVGVCRDCGQKRTMSNVLTRDWRALSKPEKARLAGIRRGIKRPNSPLRTRSAA